MPTHVLLLCPWLDLTLSNPDIKKVKQIGPGPRYAREAGLAWAGPTDPSFYQLSPLNGPLAGLPRITFFVGGRELFLPDSHIFRDRLAANCSALDFYEYPQLYHVWMVAGGTPEAERAVDEIIAAINKK